MMNTKYLFMIGISTCLLCSFAYAGDAPVVSPGSTPLNPIYVADNASIADLGSEITDLENQLNEMQNFHSDLQNDLNGLSNLKDGSSISNLLNDDKTITSSWTWTADDWNSALKSMSGGNSARYEQLNSEYKTQYPALSQGDLSRDNVDSNSGDIYQQAVKVNSAVMTQATYQFNDINNQMTSIKHLTDDINSVQTEKASTDLNSRLVSQLAYIQLAMLRMQTLTNQQLAEARAADLAADKNNVEFASHEITP